MDKGALADVVFLASSANRVRALDVLTGGSYDRYDLEEELGISRVTAKRILNDFETRGWVTHGDDTYRATPLGDVIVSEFQSLLNTTETVRKLGAVIHWLPDDFDVDPRRLADAQITLPSWSDSAAPIRRAAEVTEGSHRVRVAGSGIAPTIIRAMRDVTVNEDAFLETVMTAEAFDVLTASPEMSTWCREMIEAGAEFARHEEGFEYLLGICDDTAIIGLNDESGAPSGVVESKDKAVREWVESTISQCLAEAESVSLKAFSN